MNTPKEPSLKLTFYPMAIGLVVLIILMEFFFSLFTPFWERLYIPQQEKMRQYEEFLNQPELFDRVFTGSSTAFMGVNPAVIDQVIEGRSYNAGQLGYARPNIILEVARELVASAKTKSIIYIIDSWVGRLPTESREKIDQHGRTDNVLWLSNVFRNRDVFFYWIKKLLGGHYIAPEQAWHDQLVASGRFMKFDSTVLNVQGQLQTFGQLNPDWQGYYKPAEYGDLQYTYLQKLIEVTQKANIELILVRPPEYIATYEVAGAQHLALSQNLKLTLAPHNITLLDFTLTGAFPHDKSELFFDIHHLNAEGAQLFSEMLGQALKNDSIE